MPIPPRSAHGPTSDPAADPGPRLCVVTGGAGCGKSTAVRLIAGALPEAGRFDADACVHQLLTEPLVRDKVVSALGDSMVAADGLVDRARLRKLVLADPDSRVKLEQLLHPMVADALLQQLAAGTSPWLVAEVPLFYESACDFPSDLVIAVAASPIIQRTRLQARGLKDAEIDALLEAQWPVDRKMRHADTCLWNDGPRSALESQIALLAAGPPFQHHS